jgi:hypothetical protein
MLSGISRSASPHSATPRSTAQRTTTIFHLPNGGLNMFKKASPENAADVDAIAALLRELSIDATLEYTAISQRIGRNIISHRHLLDAARDKAEEETGSLFDVVRTVGIKRLPASATPDVGLAAIRKVRRAARRSVDRLSSVRVNDLDKDIANKVIAHRSQLGAIALVADGRKSVTIAAEAGKTGTTVPAGRVLEMFQA